MSLREIPVIRSYSPYELTFEDVEVPLEDRLGEEGEGFKLCESWLVEGRVPYAAGTIGIAQEALEIAIGWAKEMPLERWYREMRINRIGEGPSEVHRMVLARELLG